MHPHDTFAQESVLKRIQGAILYGHLVLAVEVDNLRLAFLLAEGILHGKVLENQIVAGFGEDDAAAARSGHVPADYRLCSAASAASALITLVIGISDGGIDLGFAFESEVIFCPG